MPAYTPHLKSLEKRKMLDLLETWVGINSWSENPQGLENMTQVLENAFSLLHAERTRIPLPNRKKIDPSGKLLDIPSAPALSVKKLSKAPIKILLAGHLDTVYPPASCFQKAEQLDPKILRGPGVADMKGGLVILLKALELFEKSPFADKLAWEVLINPDEEIGSPASAQLFSEKASQFDLGLVFEPAFQDGSLVNERKGSINYTIIAHGKSAHAGRDFESGRNAILALARLVQDVEALNDKQRNITVNIGSFEGGTAANIVPDLAICKINIRLQEAKHFPILSKKIHELLTKHSIHGITFNLLEQSNRPPKPFNKANRQLFEALKNCAQKIGMDIKWQPSGGVCDGNTLAAAGLPTIDTLGAVGGNLHTHDEYIYTDSLIERTQLTAHFLMEIAQNENTWGKLNE